MHAVIELNMLVVLRVFMVSSSLINYYKAPEFYRCVSKWDLLAMRVASFAKRCGLY